MKKLASCTCALLLAVVAGSGGETDGQTHKLNVGRKKFQQEHVKLKVRADGDVTYVAAPPEGGGPAGSGEPPGNRASLALSAHGGRGTLEDSGRLRDEVSGHAEAPAASDEAADDVITRKEPGANADGAVNMQEAASEGNELRSEEAFEQKLVEGGRTASALQSVEEVLTWFSPAWVLDDILAYPGLRIVLLSLAGWSFIVILAVSLRAVLVLAGAQQPSQAAPSPPGCGAGGQQPPAQAGLGACRGKRSSRSCSSSSSSSATDSDPDLPDKGAPDCNSDVEGEEREEEPSPATENESEHESF